jgi:protein-tyrosine-phosphatase/predicted ATP-grasp superfamily ATP-dependent carboligase
MAGPTTVIIAFADALCAPEVAWSLADARYTVIAAVRRGTRTALRASRFVRVCEVADPAASFTRALCELRQLVLGHGDALLMPLDDCALLLAARLGDEFGIRVCGAVGRQAAVALDKRLQLSAAAGAGFRIPETREVLHRDDLDRLDEFPCILKPAYAARVIGDSVGRGRSFIAADREELAGIRSGWIATEPMLAQPFLAGAGEGIFGLALHDRVVAWSGHRRVRMMNPSGSGSSACESLMPAADARASAERFLTSVGWRGLFMIELLRDANGMLWFMELNGRPWGSMALARHMGFEYPAWSVRRLLDDRYVPAEPAPRQPLLCRHLGREIAHLAFVARGPRSHALKQWPGMARTIWNMTVVRREQRFYNRRRDDPYVFMLDTWESLCGQLWRRRSPRETQRKTLRARSRQWLCTWAERRRQSRIRAAGGAAAAIATARRVLFLCYGNINRSAIAERHLARLLGNEVAVASCGFHAQDARPADPDMLVVAGRHGVALHDWSSRTIDRGIVAQADVILAMEASHLVRLYAEYPEARGRAFLLGCLTPPGIGALEIADPFGQPRSEYERCARRVIEATSRLARLIRASR